MYVVALLLVCNHYVRHDEKPNHDKVVAHMGLLADSSNTQSLQDTLTVSVRVYLLVIDICMLEVFGPPIHPNLWVREIGFFLCVSG
jgi:hypothetical protein